MSAGVSTGVSYAMKFLGMWRTGEILISVCNFNFRCTNRVNTVRHVPDL